MKAIILARVSTKEQEETGHSLPAQIDSLKAYAEKKNFDVVKTFSFSESAGPKIRKKFEEVLEYIVKHKDVRVLLCENVDRATRNFRDAVDLDNLRRDEGLEIHFVKDGFFINREATGNQMFMWEAKVFIGKQYLNRLSDDVKRSNWARFEDHHWPGRAPRGYKNVPLTDGKGNTIVPSEDAYLIVKLFELYATGKYSHMTLRTMLYELGLKSERGTPLSVSMIAHIIQNPFYYGLMRYNGRESTHDYEQLISKSLFDECQAVRAKWNKQPFEYAAKPLALRGIATCKQCGCVITGEVKKGRLNYYSCTNYRKNCKRVYVREEALLEPVYEVLEGIQMPQSRIDQITEELKKLGESEHLFHGNSMEGLQREYKKIEEDIYQGYKDKLAGRITEDIYDRLVQENKTRQNEILQTMGKHSNADKDFYITANRVLNAVSRAREIFESSEPEEKRAFLNMLLQNATVDGKTLGFTLRSPFNTIYETRNQPIGLPLLNAYRTATWAQIERELQLWLSPAYEPA